VPRIAGFRQSLLMHDRAASRGRRRKARIGCDLPAIGEPSRQSFRPENGGGVFADPLHGQQHPHRVARLCLGPRLLGTRLGRRLAFHGQQGLLLGLDGADLVDQQFKPVKLPADLCLQMYRQGPSVSRAQSFKPLAPVAPERRVVEYSLREQKPLDPVGVHDPLVEQRLALAAKPATCTQNPSRPAS
jgi:hypothetical protein